MMMLVGELDRMRRGEGIPNAVRREWCRPLKVTGVQKQSEEALLYIRVQLLGGRSSD
jgi:hypothetical protein